MTKSELRKIFLAQRLGLPPEERSAKSHRIAGLFFSHVDLSSVSLLHSFIPIEKFNEIDTFFIINEIRSKSAEVKISLPKVDLQMEEIVSLPFDSEDALTVNLWELREPVDGEPVDPAIIDLVLVPLICFDKLGNRVGYGKGYYDKFLKTCRPDCVKVGLSFFPPVEQIEESHSGDVRLDMCITPECVYRFP